MEVKVMRHDGRADDADGNIKRFLAVEDGYKARCDVVKRRPGKDDLHEEGNAHDRDQPYYKGFHPPHTEPLQVQEQEGIQHGDTDTIYQRKTREQLDADGHAQHFRKVTGGDGDLGEDIKRNIDIRRVYFAVGLCEVPAADEDRKS